MWWKGNTTHWSTLTSFNNNNFFFQMILASKAKSYLIHLRRTRALCFINYKVIQLYSTWHI